MCGAVPASVVPPSVPASVVEGVPKNSGNSVPQPAAQKMIKTGAKRNMQRR
jgi:hypothetical protein